MTWQLSVRLFWACVSVYSVPEEEELFFLLHISRSLNSLHHADLMKRDQHQVEHCIHTKLSPITPECVEWNSTQRVLISVDEAERYMDLFITFDFHLEIVGSSLDLLFAIGNYQHARAIRRLNDEPRKSLDFCFERQKTTMLSLLPN